MTTSALVTAVTNTLVADTADTINLASPGPIEIVNLSTTAIIWVRWDGTVAVGAAVGTIPVPPSSSYQPRASVKQLSLISSGTPQYTVDTVV